MLFVFGFFLAFVGGYVHSDPYCNLWICLSPHSLSALHALTEFHVYRESITRESGRVASPTDGSIFLSKWPRGCWGKNAHNREPNNLCELAIKSGRAPQKTTLYVNEVFPA